MPVDSIRTDVADMLPRWDKIRAAIDGGSAVKKAGDKYLPRPNPTDVSVANYKRFEQYLFRAVYYGVTGNTLSGLIGQAFAADPQVSVPRALEPMLADVNAAGLSLDQQAQATLAEVVSVGRVGLLADFPRLDRSTTMLEIQQGVIKPRIITYKAHDIINWATSYDGLSNRLSLVVLREIYTAVGGDEFGAPTECQYRVLRLVDGVYTCAIYRKTPDGSFVAVPDLSGTPLGSDGRPLPYIPFVCCGATNNDPGIDNPPLEALADLNLAHYRNSADYEEAVYLVGQPTPWISGLTQQWVSEVLTGTDGQPRILLGSRAPIPLPEGGAAGLLQVAANSMPLEAMRMKESQMLALGARLVDSSAPTRTLGEALIDNAVQSSVLSRCAGNVSAAYTQALRWCAGFVGADAGEIEYAISTDYQASRVDAATRAQIVAGWQAGLTTWSEARAELRAGGVELEDDADARDVIDANPVGLAP